MTRHHPRNNRAPRTPLGGGGPVEDRRTPKFPVPSLLDGRSYLMIESSGPADEAYVERGPRTGRMKVPTGKTQGDRRIRLHEMAHVRWTPAVPSLPDGVTHESMNAIEDRRCHKRLREIGLGDPLDVPIFSEEHWTIVEDRLRRSADPSTDDEPFAPIDIARFIAASDWTVESDRFRNLVAVVGGFDWIVTLVDAITERNGLNKRRAAWKRTLEAAKDLDDAFRKMEDTPDRTKALLPNYSAKPGSGRWGTMTIREMPLTVPLPRTINIRKRYATDCGAVPRQWNRLLTDGRVFTARRSRPAGGTVLIDQSGSMGLDTQEVTDLMAAFPGVTIATYAGSMDRGELRIIARKGKRAEDHDCRHPHSGNVVDGPALDWLNEQQAPRVWISDGYVTGCRDAGHDPNLLLDAAEKVRAGGIIQRDRLGDLLPDGGGPR